MENLLVSFARWENQAEEQGKQKRGRQAARMAARGERQAISGRRTADRCLRRAAGGQRMPTAEARHSSVGGH